MLRVQSLGAATVLIGDTRLDPSADTLFALLMRTIYAPGLQVGRDILLRSLWPGQPESRQRANLRQALYKLRLQGVRIGLTGDAVELEAAQLAPVFAIHRTALRFDEDVTRGHEPFGVFLPGYSTGWAEYDEWLAVQREAVHADVRRVLVEQLSARRHRADWTGADALAKWLLQFDPLNEEATFTVAECLARNGSKVEAMALLERYRDDLGPDATELRLSANLLRRRVSEMPRQGRARASFAPTERHFVGRDELMAELTLAMRRTKWRDGSATLLHGPPGMGKTRVTQELAKVAAIEGFRVIATDCRESDQHRPLAVFLDLVPELLEMPGAAACDPGSMRVLRRLVSETGSDARNPTVDADRADDAAAREGVDPDRAAGLHREPLPLPSVLRRSIVDLVSNVCFEQATLIVAENLQWIDELSAGVFADLVAVSRDRKYCILATSRVPSAPVLTPMLAAGMEARALQPLSGESARRLALAICSDLDTACDSDLHDWFVRASEGTPFFLRALVTHWIETGSAGGVPPTLATLIDQRLAALSDDALRTIQAAAVLGRHASVETVSGLLEFSTIRMIGAMDELASAGAYAPTADRTILFHELVARAATSKLSVPSTRLLHRRAATVLQLSRLVAEIATSVDIVEHLRDAGDEVALLEYAVRSASEFLRVGLPHRALAVCEAAQRMRETTEGWEELSRVEVAALYAAGQHARVIERLAQSDSLDRTWDESHAEDVLHFVDSARQRPILGDTEELSARALMLAECPRLSPSVRFRAANTVLRATAVGVGTITTQRAYNAALIATRALPNNARAMHELNMFYHTWFGDSEVARTSALWLAQHAHAGGNRSTWITLRSNVCYALRVTGETDAAYALCNQVFQEALEAGMTWIAALMAWNASLIALDTFDDTNLAGRWLDREECSAPQLAGQHSSLVIQENKVRLAIVRNSPEEARKGLEMIPISSVDFSNPIRAGYYYAMQLGTAAVSDNTTALTELLPTALNCFSKIKTMIGQDFLAQQIVIGLVMVDRRAEASDLLRDYLHNARRSKNVLPRYLQDARALCGLES
jgi:DNA-binding SARP family transcriptional activator